MTVFSCLVSALLAWFPDWNPCTISQASRAHKEQRNPILVKSRGGIPRTLSRDLWRIEDTWIPSWFKVQTGIHVKFHGDLCRIEERWIPSWFKVQTGVHVKVTEVLCGL